MRASASAFAFGFGTAQTAGGERNDQGRVEGARNRSCWQSGVANAAVAHSAWGVAPQAVHQRHQLVELADAHAELLLEEFLELDGAAYNNNQRDG